MKQVHYRNWLSVRFLFVIVLLLIGQSACSSEPEGTQNQAEEIPQDVPASDTPTTTPDNVDDTLSSTNDDVLFVLGEAIFRASVDNLTANNGSFLVVTGEVQNQSSSRECVYASDVRLILDGERYAPQNNVMDAFTDDLDRDFIGAYAGLCLNAGDSVEAFVAFDVPTNRPDDVTFSFRDTLTPIGIQFPDQLGALAAQSILQPDEATSVAALWTETATPTLTNTATITQTPSATNTGEPTATATASSTITNTPRATDTIQPTQTPRSTLTATPPASAVPTVPAQRTTLYISNTVNVRPCPRLDNTECAARTQLTTGTEIEAVDQVTGDTYNNSTTWWRIVYGGEILYVHSAFVSSSPPVSNPPPAQNQQPSQPQQPPATQPPQTTNVCDCSSDSLNCGNFSRQRDAQACYNHCMALTGRDVHGLDGTDNDGLVCESLP